MNSAIVREPNGREPWPSSRAEASGAYRHAAHLICTETVDLLQDLTRLWVNPLRNLVEFCNRQFGSLDISDEPLLTFDNCLTLDAIERGDAAGEIWAN